MAEKKASANNNNSSADVSSSASVGTNVPERPKCGIIMPLSAIGPYPASHWEDVKGILKEAIESAGFDADLVSEAEDSTIIQKTIIQNLYNNVIVVCDVSGKNPNVMFELGIRLTFDKPTVVVKDQETDYSFDTSPIEHVSYPSSLHYHDIIKFKNRLADKITATHKAANDPKYSTFLKHFGQFTVPKLEQKEVSSEQFIIKRLEELAGSISRLERAARSTERGRLPQSDGDVIELYIGNLRAGHVKRILNMIRTKYHDVEYKVSPNTVRFHLPDSLPHADLLYLRHKIASDLAAMAENDTPGSEDELTLAGGN